MYIDQLNDNCEMRLIKRRQCNHLNLINLIDFYFSRNMQLTKLLSPYVSKYVYVKWKSWK